MNDLKRLKRSYRTMLMYSTSHVSLAIWATLKNFYASKHAKESPFQITPELRQQVAFAIREQEKV